MVFKFDVTAYSIGIIIGLTTARVVFNVPADALLFGACISLGFMVLFNSRSDRQIATSEDDPQ